MKSFEKTRACELTDDQRLLVRGVFGTALLPPNSLVGCDGVNITIEHFDLDSFLDLNPAMPPILIGEGELRFGWNKIFGGGTSNHA